MSGMAQLPDLPETRPLMSIGRTFGREGERSPRRSTAFGGGVFCSALLAASSGGTGEIVRSWPCGRYGISSDSAVAVAGLGVGSGVWDDWRLRERPLAGPVSAPVGLCRGPTIQTARLPDSAQKRRLRKAPRRRMGLRKVWQGLRCPSGRGRPQVGSAFPQQRQEASPSGSPPPPAGTPRSAAPHPGARTGGCRTATAVQQPEDRRNILKISCASPA